jgi:isoleucyl-tRNA synthetase
LAHHHKNYIVAKGCVDRVFGDEVIILETFKGEDLLGNTYEPIFEYAQKHFSASEAWRIIAANYVTIDDGTGIVHTAPAYGADDYDACAAAGIPMFNPIDRDG